MSWDGVRPDHDARLARRRVQQVRAAFLRALRSGEQGDLRPLGIAVELAGTCERAEHLGDRAVVLLREDLGRREQDRLAAGVHDSEHRQQRDDRLAGTDLTLQQAVHRVRLRDVGQDLIADLLLAGGEREGQPRLETVEDAVGLGGACARGIVQRGLAALGEGDLERQRFVPLQAVLGRVRRLQTIWSVYGLKRLAKAHQLMARTDLHRDRVLDLGEQLKCCLHAGPDCPGGQMRRRGVDRHWLSELLSDLVHVIVCADELVHGAVHLRAPVEERDLSGEEGRSARPQFAFYLPVTEEGQPQRTDAVGDLHTGAKTSATAERDLGGLGHLGVDRDLLVEGH